MIASALMVRPYRPAQEQEPHRRRSRARDRGVRDTARVDVADWMIVGGGGVAALGCLVLARQAQIGSLKLRPRVARGRVARVLASPAWWLATAAFWTFLAVRQLV